MIRRYLLFLILTVAVTFNGCMQSENISGGSGSTTTNGFTVTIHNDAGEAVRNAMVRIRPDTYYSNNNDTPSVEGTVVDTVTDSIGTILFENIKPGVYSIEIIDEAMRLGVLIRDEILSDSLHDFGMRTVEPVGAISGVLDVSLLSGSALFDVQVYGMERIVRIDPESGFFLITGLPPANYTLRFTSTDTVVELAEYTSVMVPAGDTITVSPFAEWTNQACCTLTIAACGVSVSDTLYNYPLLIRLDSAAIDFSTAKKKGEDLRITKENGAMVTFETERWDSANATAAIWVLIDTLAGNRTSQLLYLYWGNSSASTISHSSAVFDTADGYHTVLHLNESGGKTQNDATANGYVGTPVAMDGANDVPGLAGRAQQYEGDSQYIVIEDTTGSDTAMILDPIHTISAWVNISALPTVSQGIVAAGNQFELLLDQTGNWLFFSSEAEAGDDTLLAPASVGTWTMLTVVWRNSRCYLYVNGAVIDSSSTGTPAPQFDTYNNPLFVGSRSSNSGWFEGIIDELRIDQRALSSAWIRACYETQRENQEVVSIERSK